MAGQKRKEKIEVDADAVLEVGTRVRGEVHLNHVLTSYKVQLRLGSRNSGLVFRYSPV
jgi:hypothetical protein